VSTATETRQEATETVTRTLPEKRREWWPTTPIQKALCMVALYFAALGGGVMAGRAMVEEHNSNQRKEAHHLAVQMVKRMNIQERDKLLGQIRQAGTKPRKRLRPLHRRTQP
jgi:hypothetical protein